jgi:hypothetical protein
VWNLLRCTLNLYHRHGDFLPCTYCWNICAFFVVFQSAIRTQAFMCSHFNDCRYIAIVIYQLYFQMHMFVFTHINEYFYIRMHIYLCIYIYIYTYLPTDVECWVPLIEYTDLIPFSSVASQVSFTESVIITNLSFLCASVASIVSIKSI